MQNNFLLNLSFNGRKTCSHREKSGKASIFSHQKTTDTSSIYQNFLKVPATDCNFIYRNPHIHGGDGDHFPFKTTPSGHFKVESQQVVFESKKVSVIVAHPERTKINVPQPNRVPSPNMLSLSQSRLLSAPSTQKYGSEQESRDTSKILYPELNLDRLGYGETEAIEWTRVQLPDKKNLLFELRERIINRIHTDCKVYVEKEEFNCHLIVLQSYSEMIDGLEAFKKLELTPEKCNAQSFAFIYDWMTNLENSCRFLTRENVLDILSSAKYLKINDLVEQCWAFIDNVDIFNEDTAFILYVRAKERKFEEVKQLMLPRIQGFFLVLVSSEDWLKLDVEDARNFLNSNYIRVNCEMEVFASAVRWMKYNWEERWRHRLCIFECIRFGNIAAWQLVDIKRNPVNPEYLELAKDPGVCKFIDDGLAFATIQYWYSQGETIEHLNSVLRLEEPNPRNWSGIDEVHLTYKDFLIYLDRYRKSHLLEKNKPRSKERKPEIDVQTSFEMNDGSVPLEELVPKKKNFLVFTASSYRLHSMFHDERRQSPKIDPLSTKEAKRTTFEVPNHEFSDQIRNVHDMFTESKNYLAATTKNQISVSFLGPRHKQYVQTASLFYYERESLLIFGGLDPYSSFGTAKNTAQAIYRYLPDSNTWEKVGVMPEPRRNHSVVFFRGRVFLVGGCDPRKGDFRKLTVVDTVWSFDPVCREWFSESSLTEARQKFGLVSCNHYLYAIGGQNRRFKSLQTTERFNLRLGQWDLKAPLITARWGFGVAKYRHHIWVAGGVAKTGDILNSVESYNVIFDQWTEITQLTTCRSFTTLLVMSDTLYVIGGASYTSEDQKMATSSVPLIEKWDTGLKTWKHVTEMAIPRHGHVVSYLGTQIFILGGLTTIYMKTLNNSECYCTQRGMWVRGVANLPVPLSDSAAISLPPACLISNF